MKQYYEIVWSGKNTQDLLIVKTLLYTSALVTELVNIKLSDSGKEKPLRIDLTL